MGKRSVVEVMSRGFDVGGIETFINTMMPMLAEDYDICLAFLGYANDERLKLLRESGVRVVVGDMPGSWKPSHTFFERRIMRQRQWKFIRSMLGERQFDAIHVHTSMPSFQCMVAREAVRAGVPVRVAHSHAGGGPKKLRHRITQVAYRRGYLRDATHLLACSDDAGVNLYGEDAWRQRGILAANGVDVDRFAPNSETRNCVREGVKGLVVGTVGRLSVEKNQRLLLDAFAEVVRRDPDARLWLIGDGPERYNLEMHAQELRLGDSVRFWGMRSDVADLLQGLDVFVLPSLSEGLPFTLIEAQAAGLPCLISDGVGAEGMLPGSSCKMLGLSEPLESWADAIFKLAGTGVANGPEIVRAAGYARAATVELLRRIYG